jgi:hypothetical protein
MKLFDNFCQKVGNSVAKNYVIELKEIGHQLKLINRKLDIMAKSQTDLDAEIDAETATIADVATRVAADLKKLQDLITAGAAPADLQAQFDKVNANIATLQGIDPAVTVAPPTAPTT